MNPRKSRMLGNFQVKPCMLPNLAWLITAEVPYGKFLRMSNYQGSSNPRICLFFPTMHHKAKLSQWIRNEKFVSFLTHQRWRVPLSKLMRLLGQFCVCIVRLVMACTVASCVFAGTPLWNSKQPTDCQLTGGSPYRMSLGIQSPSIFLTSLSKVVDVC